MKVNDSDMPDEKYWETLFNITEIVSWVNPEAFTNPIIEVGGGYGTFTIPIANKTKSNIISYDIDDNMLSRIRERSIEMQINNIQTKNRDVVENGFEEKTNSIDAVLLFNILHFHERKTLLIEAKRVLSKAGKIFIIHWRKDIVTPRGPSLDLRPNPNDLLDEMEKIGLSLCNEIRILEPYHWGMILEKWSRV